MLAGRHHAGERPGEEQRPTKAPPLATAAAVRRTRPAAEAKAEAEAEAEAARAETAHGTTEGVSAASGGDVEAAAKRARMTTASHHTVGKNLALADVTKARATGGVVTVTAIGSTAVLVPAATTTSGPRIETESGAAVAAGRGATVGQPLPGPASRPSLRGRAGRARVVGVEKAAGDQPVPLPGETGSRRGTEAGGPSSTRVKFPE